MAASSARNQRDPSSKPIGCPSIRTAQSVLLTNLCAHRLRDRLSDLLAELPPPLKLPIMVEDEFLRFDLGTCSVDLVTLVELARECAGREGLLPEVLAAEVEAALLAADGEFLPGWDEIEREVTGGRGTAGDVVRDVRDRAEVARVALLSALARNHLARRDPARAIPLLEQALERRPDREDLRSICARRTWRLARSVGPPRCRTNTAWSRWAKKLGPRHRASSCAALLEVVRAWDRGLRWRRPVR